MANIVVVNDGKVWAANQMLRGSSVYYHLYTTVIDWDADVHLSDMVEATFSGYSAVNVTSWGDAFLEGSVPRGQIQADAVTWTRGAGTDSDIAVGYYVTNSARDILLWGVPFDILRDMSIPGERIVVAPSIDLISIFNNGPPS